MSCGGDVVWSSLLRGCRISLTSFFSLLAIKPPHFILHELVELLSVTLQHVLNRPQFRLQRTLQEVQSKAPMLQMGLNIPNNAPMT